MPLSDNHQFRTERQDDRWQLLLGPLKDIGLFVEVVLQRGVIVEPPSECSSSGMLSARNSAVRRSLPQRRDGLCPAPARAPAAGPRPVRPGRLHCFHALSTLHGRDVRNRARRAFPPQEPAAQAPAMSFASRMTLFSGLSGSRQSREEQDRTGCVADDPDASGAERRWHLS